MDSSEDEYVPENIEDRTHDSEEEANDIIVNAKRNKRLQGMYDTC